MYRIPVLVLLAAVLSVTPATGTAGTVGTPPLDAFVYRFRVVDFSMTATETQWGATATIRYRLLKPSVEKTISYLGPRPTNRSAAWKLPYAGPFVDVVGDVTYGSRDPSCTGTKFVYKPSGNKVVQLYVELDPRIAARRLAASVRRIPVASPHPEEDGTAPDYSTKPRPKCGKAAMGDVYWDAKAVAPAQFITKPRITLAGGATKNYLEWKMRVVLQRVSYRKIDCSSHPGC